MTATAALVYPAGAGPALDAPHGYPVTSVVVTAQPTLPEPWNDFAHLADLGPGTLERELFLTKLLKAVPDLQVYLAGLRRHDANALKDAGVSFTEQSKYLTAAGFPMTPTSVSNMARDVKSSKDMARKGITAAIRPKKPAAGEDA